MDLLPPSVCLDEQGPPYAVDLDSTLLRTDTLIESVLLLRRRPWCAFLLPFWLLGGRAGVKHRIAERVTLDADVLPINEPLLHWLREQAVVGRSLHLYSTADQSIVVAVATRLGLFETARSSSPGVNFSGFDKLAAFRAALEPRCTYAGDSRKDLPIWRVCALAVLVGSVAPRRAALGPEVAIGASFAQPGPGFATWRRALRLHQWSKNALLLVATLLGGTVASDLSAAPAGFVAFGLIASATYLLNDMLDLPHDRLHRSKHRRPLASGELPLHLGLATIVVLSAAAAIPLLVLPVAFVTVAELYLTVTPAYSFRIKRMLMPDVSTIAGLFTIGIAVGIAPVNHPASPWLIAVSMFFLLSLACMKRYSKCLALAADGIAIAPGRAYHNINAPWLIAMGAASAFAANLTFFLFLIETGSPILLHPSPRWMLLICVILGYWLCRSWALAARGQMDDDPVLFAVSDRLSLVLAGVIACLVLLARS